MRYSGVLTDVTFFNGFDDEELAMMGATARCVTHPAGSRLFQQGDPASGCWFIERGHVEIDEIGDPHPVETLGPGDMVGWSWLFPPYRRHFGAVTITAVSAVWLDTDRLLRFMDNEPQLGYRFTWRMCEVVLHRWKAERQHLIGGRVSSAMGR